MNTPNLKKIISWVGMQGEKRGKLYLRQSYPFCNLLDNRHLKQLRMPTCTTYVTFPARTRDKRNKLVLKLLENHLT